MICKKCNYILSGKENFCPNCGAIPFSTPPESPEEKTSPLMRPEKQTVVSVPSKSAVNYTPCESPATPTPDIGIFNTEDDEPFITDNPHKKERGNNKKNSMGKVFVLLLICCTLAVSTFGLADYLGITPKIAKYISTFSQNKSASVQTTSQTFSHESTITPPEINYPMQTAYVFSGKGLTLRKGPSNNFAPLYNLTDLTLVQIFGASIANPQWIYVFCPEKNSFGWLDGSFVCNNETAQQELTQQYKSQEDVPTNYYREN